MARRCWIVYTDRNEFITQDDEWGSKYRFRNGDPSTIQQGFGIFFREGHAQEYAEVMATKFPGNEVYIFEQKVGFSSQPAPAVKKIWTDKGYVPAP